MDATDRIDRLYRAAWALSGSRLEAEALVQEAYARVLGRRRLLRRADDLGSLLRALRDTSLVQSPDTRAHRRPDPEPEWQELYAAVAALPGDLRLALVAVDVAGLTCEEAGRALGVSADAIRSRIYFARDGVARSLPAKGHID